MSPNIGINLKLQKFLLRDYLLCMPYIYCDSVLHSNALCRISGLMHKLFQESAEFLETYLGQCSEKDSDTWSDELSLIQFHSRQQALLDFLYVVLILSKYVVSADAVETVAVAESKFWRDIRNREQSMQYCIPNLQSTSECIKTLNRSLLYCLPVDHYKLLWHFKSGMLRTPF